MKAFMTFSSLKVIIVVVICACVIPTSSVNSPSTRISCTDSSANTDCSSKFGAGSVCDISQAQGLEADQVVNGLCSIVGNYTQAGGVATCKCAHTTVIPAAIGMMTRLLAATTVKPLATTQKPLTVTAGGCASGPKQPTFLWVENPNLDQTDHNHYTNYFATMRRFMSTNCAGVTVNRLVMKTPYPQYHFAYSAGQKIFWPPAASPFFTEIIAKAPRNIKYHLYPMLSTKARAYWRSFGGTSDVGYAIFSFASQWHKFLVSKGYAGIEGFVVDLETLLPGDSLASAAGVNRLKAKFPGIKFGATIGFDDAKRLSAMGSYTDHFFLQMYDWYRPTQGITLSARSSPFVISRNNPTAVVNYIMNTAIPSGMWARYAAAGVNKVHLMWSLQHPGVDCLNLQGESSCGRRNDFGTWSPAGFNAFLVAIKAAIAKKGMGLNRLEHGIFHYNAMRKAWL